MFQQGLATDLKECAGYKRSNRLNENKCRVKVCGQILTNSEMKTDIFIFTKAPIAHGLDWLLLQINVVVFLTE